MIAAARELQGEHDPQATLDLAVRLAMSNVEGCSAAAISVVRRGGRVETQAASHDDARRADELQYETGQGPCLDAVWREDPVHSPDLAHESRWPAWGPVVVAETGARGAMCFRLFTTSDVLGALNLYSDTTGTFDAVDLEDGRALAAHVAVAAADAAEIQGLTRALDSRTLIGQATGLVMGRYGVDAKHAFALLSRLSSHHNIKVRDLAAEIVETGRIPGEASGA